VIVLGVVGSTLLSGCGSSDSNHPSAHQLESARREGEETVRQRTQLKSLQHQVRHLKKEVHKRHPAAVVVAGSTDESPEADPAASTGFRTFHAPSGNVSCEVSADSALCSIASIDETFVLPSGEEGRLESGATLPRGAGELAPYGSSIVAGSITCSVPGSSEPRGITCVDSETDHGFEASRVPDRQSTY
jgi:hypothetical protein